MIWNRVEAPQDKNKITVSSNYIRDALHKPVRSTPPTVKTNKSYAAVSIIRCRYYRNSSSATLFLYFVAEDQLFSLMFV